MPHTTVEWGERFRAQAPAHRNPETRSWVEGFLSLDYKAHQITTTMEAHRNIDQCRHVEYGDGADLLSTVFSIF